MHKSKTNKALAKRFKVSKGGKLMRGSSGRSHLLSGKTSKRRRRLRQPSQTAGKRAATYRKQTS
ncbi:MAG: 50S ribosomal protein L35 [Phycisphaerae bacterium]|nr:50S ribosomal protein L35 [Phycisphaerae bacterium]